MIDRSLAIAARVKGRNAFVDSWAVGKLYTHISHINSNSTGSVVIGSHTSQCSSIQEH